MDKQILEASNVINEHPTTIFHIGEKCNAGAEIDVNTLLLTTTENLYKFLFKQKNILRTSITKSQAN